jgi:hypothetical protein
MIDEALQSEIDAFLSEPTANVDESRSPSKSNSVDTAEIEQFINDEPLNSEAPEQSSFLDAASDTARSIAQNAGASVAAGYEGIIELVSTGRLDEAVDAINSFQQEYSYNNQNQRSIDQLQQLDEFGREVAAGTAAGLTAPLPDSLDPSQEIYDQGPLNYSGNKVFEATGSPGLATLVESGLIAPPALSALQMSGRLPQSSAKREVARDLSQGQPTGITAGYQLADPKAREAARNQQARMELSQDRPEMSQPPRIEKTSSKGRFSPGPQRLVKQGFSPSDVAAVQSMTKDEAKIASRMASIKKETNPETGNSNLGKEPLEEVGGEINKQLSVALKAKKKAGDKLGSVLSDINTMKIPMDDIFSSFKQELRRNKVSIITDKNKDGSLVLKADLTDSKFDGDAKTQKAFDSILKRMSAIGAKNKPRMREGQDMPQTQVMAEDLQDIKNLVDYKINYGRKASDQTLSAESEKIIKQLRTDINDTLRSASKEYADANDEFSYIIRPLQKLNDATNSKIDVFDSDINPAKLGVEARIAAQDNTRSIDIRDAFDDLYDMVSENGYNTNVNLKNLVNFNYALNDRFGLKGARNRGGFAGSIESSAGNAMRNNDAKSFYKAAAEQMGKMDKRTTEGAFDEMIKYLNKRGAK